MTITVPSLNRLPAAERGLTIGDFLVPVRIGERMSSRARHIALIVAGALLIALSANYAVPVPGSPVPVTGQTFAVLLVGGALGARRGGLCSKPNLRRVPIVDFRVDLRGCPELVMWLLAT